MLLFLSVLILLIAACNHLQVPTIEIEALVSKLSEEEYDYVGTHGLDNPTKDDFRKFTFDFAVEHSTKTTRKFEFPERSIWKETTNKIDNLQDRYWFGKGYSRNNDSEHFANYVCEFVFLLKRVE
ncbi:fructose-bisphosphate aldolase [Cytobacillus sp. IB215665]|uniref:fructose-bisphosphate aldolase n=1 Tax=Cytobacillus sp. IB215665 TaxID=3097357 RepID=UPI002A117934|nr:fructose-bisphosphate aldolase [Cytobacillus sp. IB215665]MDX8365652.1 fructose-bisphosphate aldolase [Cytobacillus sp. IB215665]